MLGTLINTAAVAVGSLLGLALNKTLPARFVAIVFQVLGLFTLFLGVKMAFSTGNPMVLVFSLILGAILGEILHIDRGIEKLSNWTKKKTGSSDAKFTEGLVTAFMLFCIGPMTILGTFEEGISNNRETILTKSLMDFFSAIALSSALGKGVLFSAVLVLGFQGALTLGAVYIEPLLSAEMQNEMIAAGGIMLIGLGISILDIKKINIINMLPALLFAVVLAKLMLVLGWY